jgi:membrane-associated HD superfamily phosphohydrolase
MKLQKAISSCSCSNLLTAIYHAVLSPKRCWEQVRCAPLSPTELLLTTALPLNVAYLLVSRESLLHSLSIVSIIVGITVTTTVQLLAILLASWILRLLAPLFRGEVTSIEGLYLVVYPMIPIWLALLLNRYFFGLTLLICAIGVSLYSLYQGILTLGDTPPKSVMQFFSVVVACAVTAWVMIISVHAGLAALR